MSPHFLIRIIARVYIYYYTEITLTLQKFDTEYGNHSTIDFQCSQRHSGILCGGCQPGLSLALGTDQCLPCFNLKCWAWTYLLMHLRIHLLVSFIKSDLQVYFSRRGSRRLASFPGLPATSVLRMQTVKSGEGLL